MILSNTTTIVATILLAFSSSALCSASESSSSTSSNFLRGQTRQLSTCKMYKGPTPCFDKSSWCARLGSQYVTCATITSQQCTLFHRSTHPCPEKCGIVPSRCSNFQQQSNQAPPRNRLPLRRPVLPQVSSPANFPNEQPVNNNNNNGNNNGSSNNSNNNDSNSNSLATRAPTGPPTSNNNNFNNSDDSNNSSSNNNSSSSNNNNSTPAPTPGPTPSGNSNNDSSYNSANNNNNTPSFAPSPSPSPQPTTCADEPESTKFGYRLDEGSERNNKSCKTVAAKNWRKKCQEIATLKKGGEQLPISQLCPRTCRTCPDQCEAGYISCAPTNAPTTPAPSTTPTLSSKPSLGGNTQSSPSSNLPTLAPSASAYPTVSKGPTAVSNEIEI